MSGPGLKKKKKNTTKNRGGDTTPTKENHYKPPHATPQGGERGTATGGSLPHTTPTLVLKKKRRLKYRF